MKHDIEKNIRKLYFITVFQALVFAYVIERIFAEERGLTVLDMQYLLICYAVLSFILEIPAGVLADLWKKKFTLALGVAICFFEFFASIFAYNVFEFSLAYLAAAIGGSLKSGTIESILYQSLKEVNRESEYVRLKGRLKFVKYSVSGVAAILGGYIAESYGYEMNYWLSLVGFPFAILLILSLYEPKGKVTTEKPLSLRTSFFSHLKAGVSVTFSHKQLRMLMLTSGLIGAVLYGQLHEMSMLMYQDIQIEVKYFGYVSLGITLAGACAGLLSGRMEGLMKKGNLVYLLSIMVTSLAIFMFSTIESWWAVLFLILAIGILETVMPIFSGMIHDQASDHLRVTISSVESFMTNALSVVIGLIFGYVAQVFDIQLSFQVLAIILLLAVFARPFNSSKHRMRAKRVESIV